MLTQALLPDKKDATEADYRKSMAELDLRPLGLEVQDRASARELFRVNSRPQRNITCVFLGGNFLVLLLLAGALEHR